jgi:hypothetical protein
MTNHSPHHTESFPRRRESRRVDSVQWSKHRPVCSNHGDWLLAGKAILIRHVSRSAAHERLARWLRGT